MAKVKKTTSAQLTPEELIGKLFHGKAFTSEVKTADNNERTLLVKISSINPDRSNDIVEPKGADLTNFKKNPVVLLSHNYQSLPIAKCTDIQISDDPITAEVQFPDEGIYEVADTVYRMCKEGYLNGWSIGFIPEEYTERKDDNGWGYTFTKWQLLEFSAVAIPDNQDAITIMRSKGINVDLLDKDLKVEDAEAAIKTLDEKPAEEVIEEKEIDEPVIKEGRSISAKNQAYLDTAIKSMQAMADMHSQMATHMQAAIEAMQSINGETPDEAEPDNDGDEEKAIEETPVIEKEVTTDEVVIENADETLLARLSKSLKKTDKEVGLTLRLLKTIKEGGENK